MSFYIMPDDLCFALLAFFVSSCVDSNIHNRARETPVKRYEGLSEAIKFH